MGDPGDGHRQPRTYRWIPFPAEVTTDRVRVVVTATQDGFTRIAELTP